MDWTLLVFGTATFAAYGLLSIVRPETASASLETAFDMFLQAMPWIVISMCAAGLLTQLLDPRLIARMLGQEAGLRGVFTGALLGIFGTGSRWAMYPIAAGLLEADASLGAVFSFVTSWQLVSLTRLPAEIPFFGVHFSLLRVLLSVLLAFVGGTLIQLFRL
jgi:uncharacterized membrane protein YraQ (UPF0718 family)